MCSPTGYETIKVTRTFGAIGWVLAFSMISLSSAARGQTKTWTSTAEFDDGFLINSDGVADAADGELAIRTDPETLPYIWVACSERGTVVRIATSTFDPLTQLPVTKGQVLGEYRVRDRIGIGGCSAHSAERRQGRGLAFAPRELGEALTRGMSAGSRPRLRLGVLIPPEMSRTPGPVG